MLAFVVVTQLVSIPKTRKWRREAAAVAHGGRRCGRLIVRRKQLRRAMSNPNRNGDSGHRNMAGAQKLGVSGLLHSGGSAYST